MPLRVNTDMPNVNSNYAECQFFRGVLIAYLGTSLRHAMSNQFALHLREGSWPLTLIVLNGVRPR